MFEVDLHLHTTFSDGRLTPSQLVDLCASRGLKHIAVSDHDSMEGLAEALEAAESHPDLTIIPAIELSTDIPGSEIHMLGYFIDPTDDDLQATLTRFRDGRFNRGRLMVERLQEAGIEVSWERVQELSGGGAIGRPHVAQAMVEAGYIQYPKEAFDRYIGRDGIAYVERPKLTPEGAVDMIVRNGALPVMAHPTYSEVKSARGAVKNLRDTLTELKAAGLVGMEVFYGDYTEEQVIYLKGLADDFDLVPCGGSDYHASGNPGEPEPGSVGPPVSTVERLAGLKRDLAGQAH
ncbi:MAG: PHP domain-containing protein [SAR202 cluster bacterium]|mgnify:CR=1 FL=1|nr:phosphatase [Chloroflexota bacterium]MDP6422707.1 PHP domain-containing protein [SAR202 cluster bacterium]MDP6663955.1 PHP domain-containing protein [SAR202 cluster bacterium]MDP6798927.1 PHP domain-containing protein [SAR202 cluster bacterium]MQG58805.1 PHP domain-containing protein [SAR202 cluster bacterium]|tara:strand:+ start:2592 stop:3464 length:873 start_codon:yes stop_codon:yes gene_type:complete